MSNDNKITISIIFTNLLIGIAAGHGLGFLGLIELSCFSNLTENLTFSMLETYDKLLKTAAWISLVGQSTLFISLFCPDNIASKIKTIGSCILLVGFCYLTSSARSDEKSLLSFVTGIPFLLLTILGLARTVIDFGDNNS